MNKLILKVIFFSVLLVGIILLLDKYIPYYWCNMGFSSGVEILKKNKNDFNTFFIGSSRTKMHIIPSLFDSVAGNNIKSFNDPNKIADVISANINISLEQKQEILEIENIENRLNKIYGYLVSEIDSFQVEKKIKGRVKRQM